MSEKINHLIQIIRNWPSSEIGELRQVLTILTKETQNTEILTNFNEMFGVSVKSLTEILLGCESIQHHKGTFSFCADREDNWESYVWVNHNDEGQPIDIIFQAERYFRWSFKDHGYNSFGDFQGKTLNEYLDGNDEPVQNRRHRIENDISVCKLLASSLFNKKY